MIKKRDKQYKDDPWWKVDEKDWEVWDGLCDEQKALPNYLAWVQESQK